MSVIRFKEVDQWLAAGKTSGAPLFLLYGEEVLYKQVLDKLVAQLLGTASRTVNYTSMDGANENVPAALAAVNTYSLLAEPKIVALTDARLFVSRRNEDRLWRQALDAARKDKLAKAGRYLRDGLSMHGLQWEDLEGRADWSTLLGPSPDGDDWTWARPVVAHCREQGVVIPRASDPGQLLTEAIDRGFPRHHHLVITTPLIDKRRRLFKTFAEKGMIVDCSVPGGERKADREAQAAVMNRTVEEVLNRHQKKMGRPARQALFALTGFDLRTVTANVEKLVNFSGERSDISAEDVQRSLARTRRDPLYAFTDAVTDRDLAQSLFYLQSLMDSGEFDHPLPLLAAVTNQVRRLIVAKDFARSAFGRVWHPGCPYPLFQQQVLPAIKAYDEELQAMLTDWQNMLTPKASAKGKHRKGSKTKVSSDLPMLGRARSPYPVYRLLVKTERFSRWELQSALGAVGRADRRLKRSGPGGRLILEQVIIGICQRKHPHDR